jgi:hypothetical protein
VVLAHTLGPVLGAGAPHQGVPAGGCDARYQVQVRIGRVQGMRCITAQDMRAGDMQQLLWQLAQATGIIPGRCMPQQVWQQAWWRATIATIVHSLRWRRKDCMLQIACWPMHAPT